MKIQTINQNQNFKARHIAKASVNFNKSNINYDLYKILSTDAGFLSDLYNKIDLKRLSPNLTEHDYALWQRILYQVLQVEPQGSVGTLMIARDDKPCGAIKFINKNSFYFILGRVTWPIEPGKKEPFAGKALSLELFKLFLEDAAKIIKTGVIRTGNFPNVSKAYELGFNSVGGDDFVELMTINREKILKTLNKFKKNVTLTQLQNNDVDIDLSNKLKI